MNQSPLPLSPRSINRNTPTKFDRKSPYRSPEKQHFAHQDTENIPLSSPNGPPSSPFIENVESPFEKDLTSPGTSRKHSSPREPPDQYQHVELTEDALRENEGLTRTIKIMEDEDAKEPDSRVDDDTISNTGGAPGYAGMDDTAFSAFSAVPNADMTRFARVGQSPTKSVFGSPARSQYEEPTPMPTGRGTPSRNRRYDDGYSSPTPRRHQREKSTHDDDSTNLLDFTGQYNPIAPMSERSPATNGRHSPRKYPNDLAAYAAGRRTPSPAKHALPPGTPSESRHLANLLDFDLPPAPTPRSMPSISARELESMKSAFQSQISSLKAELSGKEAEVNSLNNAMGDAERRVGEAQEQVREERGLKEGLQAEKADWEKREQEMKDVLRSVKEEIIHSDREKDRLMQRATEAEYKREEAEAKAMEAESKVAGLQAGSAASATSPEKGTTNTSSEVEAAVTKVAKELHGLYKGKHEAKVTALKKSYSDRWEKRIKDLQSQIDSLSKENDDLRIGRDATMTGVDPIKLSKQQSPSDQRKSQEAEALQQRLTSQISTLETMTQELSTLKHDLTTSHSLNNSLQSQLDLSRAETADLIAATEELMALSQSAMSSSQSQQDVDQQPSHLAATESRPANNFSRSTSGSSSGLKAPGFGIRPPGGYGYGNSRERGGSGTGGKSGLLGNIERMGRGYGGH